MSDLLAAFCFGLALAGMIGGLAHLQLFLRRTGSAIYQPRRDSLDWRATLAATAWLVAAGLFCLILLLDLPITGAGAVVLSFATAELYFAFYAPGIGLSKRLAEFVARIEQEQGLAPRSLPARIVRGVPLLLAAPRPIFRGLSLADTLMWLLWVLLLPVALIGLIGAWGVSPATVALAYVVLPTSAVLVAHLIQDFDAPFTAGYLPKQMVRDEAQIFALPENQLSRTSRDGGIAVEIRKRQGRARVLMGLMVLQAGSVAALMLGGPVWAALLPVAVLTGVVTVHHLRRVVAIWEDVGIAHANRLSVLFMKESAHQLKNMLEPISYALEKSKEFHEAAQPLAARDPVDYAFVGRRVDAGVRGVGRLRNWLEHLRAEARSLDDRRKVWLSPERDTWVSLSEIVAEWLESAAGMRNTERPEKARQPRLTVAIHGVGPARRFDDLNLARLEEATQVLGLAPGVGGSRLNRYQIKLDHESCHDILRNITRNALQALKSGSSSSEDPTVDLILTVREGDRYPIVFSVRDNGPGIPEALRNSIFEPVITTKESGMGLGLFMAREYLQCISGRIFFTTSASKRFGSFTTFVIELPASRCRYG